MNGPVDDGAPGDDEPDPTIGGPPHPMDRIWRHPSELPLLASERPGRAEGRPGSRRARSLLGPLGAGAVGALLTVTVLAAAGMLDQRGGNNAGSGKAGASRSTDAVAAMTRRVAPAIVSVRVVTATGTRAGSGVCVRHGGQVLTSNRLVGGATRVQVVTSDGSSHTARVIGRDPASDLSLLSIDGSLEAADLATPAVLRIGDPVYAVGAGASGTPWVSEGIVASLAGRVASDGTTMSGLIEASALGDASIAGGALLDDEGRVAGILMTPVSGNPTTIAVPIRFASRIADGLRATGRVEHGWLGLAGKVTRHGQVVVTALAAGGPSDRAGIRVGDVVMNADFQPIATMGDLMATARGHWPGDRIPVEIERNRSDLTVSVQLAGMPPAVTDASVTTKPS